MHGCLRGSRALRRASPPAGKHTHIKLRYLRYYEPPPPPPVGPASPEACHREPAGLEKPVGGALTAVRWRCGNLGAGSWELFSLSCLSLSLELATSCLVAGRCLECCQAFDRLVHCCFVRGSILARAVGTLHSRSLPSLAGVLACTAYIVLLQSTGIHTNATCASYHPLVGAPPELWERDSGSLPYRPPSHRLSAVRPGYARLFTFAVELC